MELHELKSATKKLATYLGSNLTVKTIDVRCEAWYKSVEGIPGGEVLAWIYKSLQEDLPSFPNKLPPILWEYWTRYKADNPHKIQGGPQQIGCKWCHKGLIFANREAPKVYGPDSPKYQHVFRCGSCRTSSLHGIPFAKIGELEHQGWEITSHSKQRVDPQSRKTSEVITHASNYEAALDEVPF